MAKAIMIQGTMSNAGKSLLTAGLCRIFSQDGFRVAPFKSQNMALNSYITEEGLEMGRAQVVQAEAAGICPSVDMNPILLKPSSDIGSQVIVQGIPVGTMAAREYFQKKQSLIPKIMESYRRLDAEYDILVIEGAGSPAEINLKQDDIVNMGMARLAGAPVILAGDIDRGGVFAQLYGTLMLLEPEERAMVKGLIINKFRGDRSILDPGVKMLTDLCKVPTVGVVPYMNVDLEDEDSLSSRMERKGGKEDGDAGRSLAAEIVVVRFPRLSNFTDFHVLEQTPGLSVRYVDRLSQLGTPDLVILPGTKNTVDDLLWMRQSGLEAAILSLASRGIPVWGICGGYQMMGLELVDEEGTEAGVPGRTVPGMGLFLLQTRFREEKTRTRVKGCFSRVSGIFSALSGMEIEGYEIHMGQTGRFLLGEEQGEADGISLLELQEFQQGALGEKRDGFCRGNLYGTYVHGIFGGPGIARAMAGVLLERKGLDPGMAGKPLEYRAYRENQYDRLAETLRAHLDLQAIYDILKQGISEMK